MSVFEISAVTELDEYGRGLEPHSAGVGVPNFGSMSSQAKVFRIDLVERVTTGLGRLLTQLGFGPDSDFSDTYLLLRVKGSDYVETDHMLQEIFSAATIEREEVIVDQVRAYAQAHLDVANKPLLGPNEEYLSRFFVLGSFSESTSEIPGYIGREFD